MQTKNNGGDVLARGGIRANFPATDGGVSKDKWAAAFDDFDPEAFKAAPNPAQARAVVESEE